MPARSIALLVLVTAVWGVNFVVIHAGLEHFPPCCSTRCGSRSWRCRPCSWSDGPDAVADRARVRLPARRREVRARVRQPRPRDAGRPGLAALQLQVIFTIVFAGFVLRNGHGARRSPAPRSRSPALP
jgi:O-acetylserine/cysteine efflux transporter